MKLCKSIFVFGILALVLAGLAGCGSTGSSAAPIGTASGTASATAMGFVGDITVTITMLDGYITDVQVVGDETPSVGDVAVIRAPRLIQRRNSGVLDSISGASITTAGISAAAQEAINKIVAASN